MYWFSIAVLAAFFSGLTSIIEKHSLKKIHALQFSTIVNVLVTVLSACLIPLASFQISALQVFLIFITSITSTIGFLLVAKALRHGDISISSPLLSTTPLFLTLLATIFLKEFLNKQQYFGIVLIVVGAFVLEVKALKQGFMASVLQIFKDKTSKYALLAAFSYAISSLILRFVLTSNADFYTVFLLLQFFTALDMALITITRFGFEDLNVLKHKKVFYTVLLASVTFFISRVLTIMAINLTFVALAISIIRLSTLFSTIAGGLLYHEDHLLKKTIASVIMLLGVFLINS